MKKWICKESPDNYIIENPDATENSRFQACGRNGGFFDTFNKAKRYLRFGMYQLAKGQRATWVQQ